MLYVEAWSSILNVVKDTHSDLASIIKALTGEKLRRVDRYTLLAIAGALQCGNKNDVLVNSGLVLATSTGTLSTTIDIMEKVGVQKLPPKPFQFVNSLGNSACFSLAKFLEISGPSLAVSRENISFESALKHAELMMASGAAEQMMVGGVDEAPLPISDHLRRHNAEHMSACFEGAHWLRTTLKQTDKSRVKLQLLGEFELEGDIEKAVRNILSDLSRDFEFDSEQISGLAASDIFVNRQVDTCQTPEESILPHGVYSGYCFFEACSELSEKQKTSNALKAIVSFHDEVRAHISLLEPC